MIFDLIQKRRSVFPAQYNNQPITKETLLQLMEAANWAPNHAKTEPWRFKVLMGDKRKELGIFLSRKYEETAARVQEVKVRNLLENPQKAAAIIAICMQRDAKERIPEWEEVAATAMAVQNMWLACTELGIGCYWSSPGTIKFMHEFMDMAEGEKCLGFLYLGYFEGELPEGSRQPLAEKITWL